MAKAATAAAEPEGNGRYIWDQVVATDPQYTKGFSRGGGFKGTAINALYNIGRATKIFGPMGIGFGYTVQSEQILTGHPIRNKADEIIASQLIHEIKINFWYRDPASKERGEFPSSGATTFVQQVGKDNGYLTTDEEVVKKSITDAISKALSWLGFSADVFLGLYDDNKYVNDAKKHFDKANDDDPAGEALASKPAPKPEAKPAINDPRKQAPLEEMPKLSYADRCEQRIAEITDKGLLQGLWEEIKASAEWAELVKADRAGAAALKQKIAKRAAEIAKQNDTDLG